MQEYMNTGIKTKSFFSVFLCSLCGKKIEK
jgi:hypothetical protein